METAGWSQIASTIANRIVTLPILALLAGLSTVQADAAGICTGALRAVQNSDATAAEERPFPIQCNWNYIFALEDKMLRLGDLKRPRPPEAYDHQIDSVAVKLAQRRVGLPETGVVDTAFFVSYMSLP